MASRAVEATALVCAVLALAAAAEAKDLVVGGGGGGWKVPAQADALNKWAQVTRFQVGDNLVFRFDGAADAVLEVTKDDYGRCSTASPVATYKAAGGATVPLTRSGAHYFVSGAPGSCDKGERLIVVVMSDKHGGRSHGVSAQAPAPVPESQSPIAAGIAPAPAPATAPAPAPESGDAGRTVASGGLLLAAALLGAAATLAGF
ncbi:hypothetical protein GUJ93_ZPchr0008g11589 [Zizania palustris]|uniref:Phytocyanin domain-containing protein n=1 Tax=Zizania palustris TaxID=103762 RepID=A0A8J5RL27_ZIZPA|nr:hypothetical protein GUJ93_ZPchr0008g11589 [Zizania palustris]